MQYFTYPYVSVRRSVRLMGLQIKFVVAEQYMLMNLVGTQFKYKPKFYYLYKTKKMLRHKCKN